MVLRPGLPISESVYPGDEDPRSLHVAARLEDGGEIFGVGSVLAVPPPWDPESVSSWRIRGMAVREGLRGNGAGTAVLGALLGHVRDQAGTLVWCAARLAAVTLYEQAGFETRGERFEAPWIGLHVHMWRTVDAPL